MTNWRKKNAFGLEESTHPLRKYTVHSCFSVISGTRLQTVPSSTISSEFCLHWLFPISKLEGRKRFWVNGEIIALANALFLKRIKNGRKIGGCERSSKLRNKIVFFFQKTPIWFRKSQTYRATLLWPINKISWKDVHLPR